MGCSVTTDRVPHEEWGDCAIYDIDVDLMSQLAKLMLCPTTFLSAAP